MRITTAARAALLALLTLLALSPASSLGAGANAGVTGGGWFLFGGAIPMQFGFAGVQRGDGTATGMFHHFYTDDVGTYEMWGAVTCLAFDPESGRAWVGGVLTKVSTTDPEFTLGPGDDAWFRVLDSPEGDRSTAMGFVGDIGSSEEYCQLQIWPEDNARTHPVTSGEITVQAR
jgi:hypothetical protein